jgi:hypothetical protein
LFRLTDIVGLATTVQADLDEGRTSAMAIVQLEDAIAKLTGTLRSAQ